MQKLTAVTQTLVLFVTCLFVGSTVISPPNFSMENPITAAILFAVGLLFISSKQPQQNA